MDHTHVERHAIAIVGMACRFPQANHYSEFWTNLKNGKNSIREIPVSRWNQQDVYSSEFHTPDKTISKWCGLIDDIDQFDAAFFGISARESKSMDPQQRLLLQEAVHCIEDSAIPLSMLQQKRTGVYIGVMAVDYLIESTAEGVVTDSYACLGNYECILANRLSYIFDLRGPSFSIDAACGSSLVAMHQARLSLLAGETDYAIAGGVSLNLHPWKYISFSKARMLSPDGQCKTFDVDANGYVPGEGAGVILLQRLEDALQEKNHIYGVILGSAVHHVGDSVSITSPSIQSQQNLILEVLKESDVNPETISYVEAHGTGTSLGDPIEVAALSRAFEQYTSNQHFCHLGSVKSNIGHLEAAAGVAGVIKVLLMMQNRQIPPTLNITRPNPLLFLENSPFLLPLKCEEWKPAAGETRMRAGVSSFGFGGTISHLVLESPPVFEPRRPSVGTYPFLLSAKTPEALQRLQDQWLALSQGDDFHKVSVLDSSGTLATGREHHAYRWGCGINQHEDLQAALQQKHHRAQHATWALCIGNSSWGAFREVKPFLRHATLMRKTWDVLKRSVAVSPWFEAEDGLRLQSDWTQGTRSAQTFLVNYLYLSSIIDLGFSPALIAGSGSGIWESLALTGMLAPVEVLAILYGKMPMEAIKLSSPKLPFYDAVSDQIVAPMIFQRTYFITLIQSLNIATQNWDDYLEEVRALEKSQYTFKSYLNEWTAHLQLRGLSIERLLSDDPLSPPEDILKIIVIQSALLKLYRKWNLSPHGKIYDPYLQELTRLITSTDIDKSLIVNLVFGDLSHLDLLVDNLNQSAWHEFSPDDFPLLHQQNMLPATLVDFTSWFEKTREASFRLSLTDNMACFQFGTRAQSEARSPEVHIFSPTSLLDTCLALWQAGVNIAWNRYFLQKPFHKVPLPVYPFGGGRHWLSKQAVDVQPATHAQRDGEHERRNAHVEKSREMNGRLMQDQENFHRFTRQLSPVDDAVIRDTVVEGQCITPSPLRLELALQAGKRRFSSSANCLSDVYFPSPGIIVQNTKIVVDMGENGHFQLLKYTGEERDTEAYDELLAKGRVEQREVVELSRHRLDELVIENTLFDDQLYALFNQWGYQYGPSMKLIRKIEQTRGAFLIHIQAKPTNEAEYTGLDPFVLDCMFQGVFYVGHTIGDLLQNRFLYVPISIKHLILHAELTERCYAVVNRADVHTTEEGDIRLNFNAYNDRGEQMLSIDNIYFRRVQRNFLSSPNQEPDGPQKDSHPVHYDTTLLLSKTTAYIKSVFGDVLGQPGSDIDEDAKFQSIGVDSLVNQEIVEKLACVFPELPSTVLFEYTTIKQVVAYFIKFYEIHLCELLSLPLLESPSTQHVDSAATLSPISPLNSDLAFSERVASDPDTKAQAPEPIAIIGCSGRFPQSPSIEALWENLKQGKNCIAQVPEERWAYEDYYDADKQQGKSYTKWGGFLEGFDEFDPLFFQITPKQAQFMDPQQRIFLQAAWSSIEDAGYTRSTLPQHTGVFVGVTTNTYALWAAQQSPPDNPQCPDTDLYDVANRVSYFCDFQGPSMSVDTACSSSLSCVHLAVQSLQRKECDMAIAGGVSLTLHPNRIVQFCRKNMLSSENYCHPFGEGKGGFVDAEGVGSIVLKPLSQAIKDRDYIYGVIRGTAINSGGRTGGYTVPSPSAQAKLVLQAIERAGISPRTISYVETHGTGTTLGDPIEIEGLTQAFQQYTDDTQFCAVGSVKSNIGHLIAAAGISGLIKVLLQMKYRTLVPSIHSMPANPRIPFPSTPFYVQQEVAEWKADYPRRAGISSFGVGGSNAHVIVEEYVPPVAAEGPQSGTCLIVLSAKNKDRLHAYVQKLLNFLSSRQAQLNLHDIAYTLQVGREAMEERLAFVVSNMRELVQTLEQISAGGEPKDIDCFQGNADASKKNPLLQLQGEAGAAYLKVIIEQKQLSHLAQLWVQGADVNWHLLYPESEGERAATRARRIPLPSYPYDTQRYWLPQADLTAGQPALASASLHPLLDRVDSARSLTLEHGVAFQKMLSQTHWVVKDHVVNEQPVLPGAAYLELARAAAAQIHPVPLNLNDVIWQEPLVLPPSQQPVKTEIHVLLKRQGDSMAFEVQSVSQDGSPQTHAHGRLTPMETAGPPPLAWQEIQARCPETLEQQTLYADFHKSRLQYGEAFQCMMRLHKNDREALAFLRLPETLSHDFSRYQLHPALMDAALQTALVLRDDVTVLELPFMVEEVAAYHPLSTNMIAYVTKAESLRTDIYLLDETGKVCVQFRSAVFQASKDPLSDFFFTPEWVLAPPNPMPANPGASPQTILVILPPQDGAQPAMQVLASLQAHYAGDRIIPVREADFVADAFQEIHRIYFLAGLIDLDLDPQDLQQLEVIQAFSVHALHRIVKSLAHSVHTNQPLWLTVLTAQIHDVHPDVETCPWVAGLAGLTKTLIREYPHWKINRLSLNPAELIQGEASLAAIFAEPPHVGSEEVALYKGQRYIRHMIPTQLAPVAQTTLRQRGVYVIAGGLGGVGQQLSEYLAENVQARLILLGRKPMDAERAAQIAKIITKGADVLYVPTDLTSWRMTREAIAQGKARFGAVHGVFNSAIILQDKALENMDEDAFRSAYDTKVHGSINLYHAVAEEPLDFIIFFSSILSITGNPGQGNYVAGGTFQDAFSRYLNQRSHYLVQVINWGYWGTVGIVATEDYQRRMSHQGMRSIQPDEGMEAIKRILAHRQQQVVAIKADRQLQERMYVKPQAKETWESRASLAQLAGLLNPPSPAQADLFRFQEGYAALRQFAHQRLFVSFQDMGLLDAAQADTIPPRFSRFSRAARRLLAYSDATSGAPPVDLSQQQVRLAQQYPEIRAHLDLLVHCMEHYPLLLREEIQPTQVMFPNNSMEKVEGIYRDNPVSDYFNALAAQSILTYIEVHRKACKTSETIRILEIGAGTGGTSARVLEAIQTYGHQLEYIYTDVSNFFLVRGRKQFAERYPFMAFQLLDIAKDPASQGFQPNRFDIVLATNALHATPDIKVTLNNVETLLNTYGWLVLNEMTQVQDLLTLTFGLLDGWWLYEDEEYRIQDSPLLTPETWQQLFRESGFQHVERLGPPPESGLDLAQSVLVGEKSRQVAPEVVHQAVVPAQAFSQPEDDGCTLVKAVEEVSYASQATARKPVVVAAYEPEADLEQTLLDIVLKGVEQASGIAGQDIDEDKPFSEYGIDSITGIELINELNQTLGISLSKTALFDHTTVTALAAFIAGEYGDDISLVPDTPVADRQDHLVTQEQTYAAGKPPSSTSSTIGPHCLHYGFQEHGNWFQGEEVVQHYRIAVEDNNCIRDHVIYGQYIMPSDAYLEMLYIGTRKLLGYTAGLQVENFDLQYPMITFPGIPLDCQLKLIPDAKGHCFAIQSRRADQAGAYQVSVDGRFKEITETASVNQDFQQVVRHFETEVLPSEIYTPDAILKVSSSYQTIQNIRIQGDIAVSQLKRSPEGERLRHQFVLEPSIVDGLFATGLYFASFLSGNQKNFFIPVLYDRVKIFRELHDDLYYGVVKAIFVKAEHITCDLALVDEQGHEALTFQGFHLQKILAEDLQKNAQMPGDDAEPVPAGTNTRANAGPVGVEVAPFGQFTGTNGDHEPGMNIAIIGMAGRFPMADGVDEFWQNLSQGKNCVSEVPWDRWSIDEHYDPDPDKRNKTYSKWGGFLKDIDRFDSLFFQMSGTEGELSDPQQRVFLEDCWHTLEDAGYSDDSLSGVKLGVFAGATKGDYQLQMHHEEGAAIESFSFPGNEPSVMAARISYVLNLKGPSIAINTACSSSLVAINLACQSLLAGESDMALAGGIHICTTPLFYKLTSKAGMLSPTGQCRAFDNDANGFVPGEASAAILLKPLDKAIRDGDHIYGVIRGVGVNQDGKTNGMTAPSSASQTELEVSVYEKYGISPDSINYIETHGTGTKLGDPIEIEALTNSFRKFTQDKQFCPIGSVKSNIGHTAYAAGISGVIKVLLSLKHKTIVPSLHCEQLNEFINFQDSPFYVNQELQDWTTRSGDIRRAAISSFGISGTNCHLVIDEAPPLAQVSPQRELSSPCFLVPISAKTASAFAKKCEDLLQWLAQEGEEAGLADIAYTLQVGRSHFAYRAGFIVRNKQELMTCLESAQLEPKRQKASRELRSQGRQLLQRIQMNRTSVEEQIYTEQLEQLARLYEQGFTPDWADLHQAGEARRLSMPTYPFERERLWIPQTSIVEPTVKAETATLHPLLDRIHPGLSLQQGLTYEKTFQVSDWFLQHHQIGGQCVLPGVVYLEMARAAFALAVDQPFQLSRIVWSKPLVVEQPKQIQLVLQAQQSQHRFVIQGTDGDLYGHGELVVGSASDMLSMADKVERLRTADASQISREILYSQLQQIGVDHGRGFQCVQRIYLGQNEALAELTLDPEWVEQCRPYTLSPILLDGCLQLGAAVILHQAKQVKRFFPYSVEKLELLAPLDSKGYVHLEEVAPMRFTLSLLNAQGQVCLRLHDVFYQESKDALSDFFYVPRWLSSPLPERPSTQPPDQTAKTVLFVSVNQDVAVNLQDSLSQVHAGDDIWEIKLATHTEKRDGRCWQVDYTNPQAIAEVLQVGAFPCPEIIYFMGGIQDDPLESLSDKQLQRAQQLGVLSLLRLIQALIKLRWVHDPIQLRVLTEGAYAIESHERTNPLPGSLLGLAKTVVKEYPQLQVSCVDFRKTDSMSRLATQIQAEPIANKGREVVLRHGERFVLGLEPLDIPGAEQTVFRHRGVYLILGGAGGIGFVLSCYLAEHVKARIVWIGRRALDSELQEKIGQIEAKGGKALYLQADASDLPALQRVVAQAKSQFDNIHGVIHSALVLRDKSLANMDEATFLNALAPKVQGSVNLQKALHGEPLDFFLFFSSGQSFTCYAGQSNYAAACTFKDAFARYMQDLAPYPVKILNWGYWGTVGVVSSEAYRQQLAERGLFSIDPAEGMEAIERVMASPLNQVVPMKVSREHLDEIGVELYGQTVAPAPATETIDIEIDVAAHSDAGFGDKVQDFVTTVFAEALKIKTASIDAQASFDTYGMDSLIITQVLQTFERHLGPLPVVTLYQYNTTESLVQYFIEHHRDALEKIVGAKPLAPLVSSPTHGPELEPIGIAKTVAHRASTGPSDRDIAIIGLSGKYPMADDLDQFWHNLKQGKSCIREVPQERWNWKAYYSENKYELGAIYTKWGGFIDDVDKFDSFFFAIPPNEARLMDPQERLIVESAWSVLEDAGYTRQALSKQNQTVAVFVGVMHSDYESLAGELWSSDSSVAAHSSFWSMANRISYLFDFDGPSMAVDTACSSSLTAVHLAYESLMRGECDLAIAGGVNLILHPKHYLRLSAATMLTQGKACKSFGADADGFVDGEGVGTVLLKPLAQAEADGDHIYSVIKGSSMNSGGKTSGYTVPNPNAQSQVIVRALRQANIDPKTITYVEAHGTGTSIGDPIEVAALTQAYRELGVQLQQQCAIGSVKSNIGHLESAAGMAGLTKVLLQMKHGMVAPSLHATTLNPHIAFEESPFCVQQELAEWQPVCIDGQIYPRRAGLSSFGAGGTNHHLIVEEYPHIEANTVSQWASAHGPLVFLLSAKHPHSLLAYAQRYVRFLQAQVVDVENLTYTLQQGREAMSERLAIVFSTQHELMEKLSQWVLAREQQEPQDSIAGIFQGGVQAGTLVQETPYQAVPDQEKAQAAAQAWVSGQTIDWQDVYGPREPGAKPLKRLSLPTYPFRKERHWLPTAPARLVEQAATPHHIAPSAGGASSPINKGRVPALSVAVIGAGPAGLTAAKSLLEDGHAPTVFEKTDRIGGIWCFRDDHRGGPYQSTRLQTSKFTSLFSDFPAPDSMSIFPEVAELNQYFNDYADHFELSRYMQLNTALEKLEQNGDGWSLTLRQPDASLLTQRFDAVCICTGNFWKPKTISYPGMDRFQGDYLHSSNYHSPEIFRGKRVLVIGNGVSGMDISVDALQEAKQVMMSLRSKKMVIPRMFGFTTNDGSISSVKRLIINQQQTSNILSEWRASIPQYMADLEDSGLLPEFPVKDNILLVNCDFPRAVSQGQIQLKPEVRALSLNQCEFQDGSRADIDMIVDCTGYHQSYFPFLPDSIQVDALYKHQFHPDYHTLCFIGRKGASLSVIPTMELEARWFSKVLSGACTLPDADTMRQIMVSDQRKESKREQLFPSIDSSQQNMWLAEQIGAFPSPVKDWQIYWKLINMPAIPAVYRLVGPNLWPQAESFLEALQKKLYINKNDPRIEAMKFVLLAKLGRTNLDIMVSLGQISQAEKARALGEQLFETPKTA